MDTSSPLLIPRALPRPRGLPCLRVPWPGLPSPLPALLLLLFLLSPRPSSPRSPWSPHPTASGPAQASALNSHPQTSAFPAVQRHLPRHVTKAETPEPTRSLHELSPQGAASCSLTPTGGWSLSPEGSQAPGPRPQPLPGTGQRSLPWTTAFRLQSPATSFPSPGLPPARAAKGNSDGSSPPRASTAGGMRPRSACTLRLGSALAPPAQSPRLLRTPILGWAGCRLQCFALPFLLPEHSPFPTSTPRLPPRIENREWFPLSSARTPAGHLLPSAAPWVQFLCPQGSQTPPERKQNPIFPREPHWGFALSYPLCQPQTVATWRSAHTCRVCCS